MSQWIQHIRQSDNRVKLRYLLLFSGFAAIFVVAIWAMAVRGIIETNTTPSTVAQKPDTSFFEKIGSAWNGIAQRTKNTFEFFKEKIATTNEITVEKP